MSTTANTRKAGLHSCLSVLEFFLLKTPILLNKCSSKTRYLAIRETVNSKF